PYRTIENVIEGAVLTFVDIGGQKRAEEQFRKLSAELEKRGDERVAEVERINQDLQRGIQQRQQTQNRRATDNAPPARPHDPTAQMANEDARQKLLQASLDAAIELTHANMGTLQLFDQPTQTLRLVAYRGFKQPFLDHFANVSIQSNSSCGEALRRGDRVL